MPGDTQTTHSAGHGGFDFVQNNQTNKAGFFFGWFSLTTSMHLCYLENPLIYIKLNVY